MKKIFATLTLSLLAMSSAYAASIAGLYNTGVGASGDLDQNYQLQVLSGETVLPDTHPYISSDSSIRGEWLANSAISKWVTPTAWGKESLDPNVVGVYSYKLNFSLDAAQLDSTSFTGRMASDNAVTVYLNGHILGSSVGFNDWSSFSAGSGQFVSGLNTVQFVVQNEIDSQGNPTGLRAEFLSSTTPVPEPETYAMLLGGLGLLGAMARRRKQV